MPGSGGGSSSSKPKVWKPQGRQLKQIYEKAEELYKGQGPLQYYPGGTVAGYGPTTHEAFGGITERAREGSGLMPGAEQYATDVIGGRYLSPESNPYLRSTYESAADALTERFQRTMLPEIEGRFARAGQTGSRQYQGALGRAAGEYGGALADLGTSIYGGAYETERGRQNVMARDAGAIRAAGYQDVDRLRDVGREEDIMSQMELSDEVKRFEFEQMEPWQRLGLWSSAVGAPISGQGTTTQGKQWWEMLLGGV